jgi:hypothetical protein
MQQKAARQTTKAKYMGKKIGWFHFCVDHEKKKQLKQEK